MAFTIDLLTWLKGIVYDKEEVDDLLDNKSNVGHTHGDIYYTETEVDTLLSSKADSTDVPTKTSDLENDGDGNNAFLTTHQDISGKEDKSNKLSSTDGWSSTLSDTKYPSEKLVKTELNTLNSNKISKSSTTGLVKNDGTIDTNTYLTEHQSLTNYVQKSSTAGLIKNDGTIDTNTYLTATDISGKQDKSNIVTSSADWSSTLSDEKYPSEKLVKNSLDAKTVTVEKQSTAETGYVATYVVKQGGSQVGSKINIPKDYLVKSASLEVCDTDDDPVTGYEVGDKYLDFVINTKDSSGTDEHIYILVSDLIDTYTADESTLTLSNSNEFSIKTGGVTSNELASNAVTTAKITDANVTRAKLASAVTDELDSKLEADDIDVSFNSTTGVLTISVGE
jgi:hypothetical protein